MTSSALLLVLRNTGCLPMRLSWQNQLRSHPAGIKPIYETASTGIRPVIASVSEVIRRILMCGRIASGFAHRVTANHS
ncbi:MAG: hypothetical protein ABIB93_04490 [Chloroflexota bacterium]